MGEIVVKEMKLYIIVDHEQMIWSRIIKDPRDLVVWEDLNKTITENELTTTGLVEWVEQMRSIPHWNIKEIVIRFDHIEVPVQEVLEEEVLEEEVLEEEVLEEEVLEEEVLEEDLNDEYEDEDDDPAELLMELLAQLAKKKKKKKKKQKDK